AILLAAQVEEQATLLPDLEDALRQAQSRSAEQRGAVSQVQQQIQVLAAEQRIVEEQSRQLGDRRERLVADRNALAAPDEVRLAKHGLEGMQGLWSRIHVEQGWESALEAALRERMYSLEVSVLDRVRAFGSDAPPAKLAFYSPPQAGAPEAASALPRLADLLRL